MHFTVHIDLVQVHEIRNHKPSGLPNHFTANFDLTLVQVRTLFHSIAIHSSVRYGIILPAQKQQPSEALGCCDLNQIPPAVKHHLMLLVSTPEFKVN